MIRGWSILAMIALGATPLSGNDGQDRILLGSGEHTYEWVKDWAKVPAGMGLGPTHGGTAVDGKGHIYVTNDQKHAILIFDAEGNFIKKWESKLGGGAHHVLIRKEGDKEFVYIPHLGRHEVVKATLEGEVVMSLPYPERAGVYKKADEYNPTDVAVAPNGDIYVGDGYGKSWVHHYDAKGEYIRSWGGEGAEPGKLNGPHGIAVDTRQNPPVVVVADRENNRLQTFTLDGKPLRVISDDQKRPSAFSILGDVMAVAHIAGRVTLLDKEYKPIVHLGEAPDPAKTNRDDLPPDQWQDGIFISPHGLSFDPQGNLYVEEWQRRGRVIKLARVKGAK